MKPRFLKWMGAAAVAAMCASPAWAVLDLTGQPYGTYGDGNSYSLPVSAFLYDLQYGGGTGPGNPFYIDSSPGQISGDIVIATGAGGTQVTTNFPGMDDAMATPNGTGGSNFFSGVWHSDLAAFLDYLDGYTPLFLFNNNQLNSGGAANQTLAVWAQIRLEGAGKDTIYFDLTNEGGAYKLITEGGGGTLNGDPRNYTSTGSGPVAGTSSTTDYVYSGGQLCLNAIFQSVSCQGAYTYGPFNHNLGANQAAYAVDVPEFNLLMTTGGLAGYTDFYLDLRMGCDPATGSAGSNECLGRDLNNGYEQVFVLPGITEMLVPEPGSLVLMLAGLGAALCRRRRAG